MNVLLLAAALGVIAGGSLAVAAGGATGALAGLLAIMVVAPLLADPLPSPLALAIRSVAALLTVELLWVVLQRAPELRRPSPLGLPALIVVGAAAALAGIAIRVGSSAAVGPPALDAVVGAVLTGPDVARAAAIALGVLAVPALLGRGGLGAVSVGALVLLGSAELLRVALSGPLTSLEHLGLGVLQVALAGATLAVASAVPAGPPLAGRIEPVIAPDGLGRDTGLVTRTRIPVWPGIRSVTPRFRRRDTRRPR